MKKTFTKPIIALAALGVIGAGAGAGALASAQTATSSTDANAHASAIMQGKSDHPMQGKFRGGHGRGTSGTVTSVSGNIITIVGENGTSYTINASDTTKVSKMVDLTVADIKVGDRIGAEGTLSGTTVTATHIMDGIPAKPAAPTSGN